MGVRAPGEIYVKCWACARVRYWFSSPWSARSCLVLPPHHTVLYRKQELWDWICLLSGKPCPWLQLLLSLLQSSHSGSNANNIPEYLPGHGGQLVVVVVFDLKSPWIQLPINVSVPGVCTLFHILGLCLNYNFWHIARELWMLKNEWMDEKAAALVDMPRSGGEESENELGLVLFSESWSGNYFLTTVVPDNCYGNNLPSG